MNIDTAVRIAQSLIGKTAESTEVAGLKGKITGYMLIHMRGGSELLLSINGEKVFFNSLFNIA